MDPNDALKKAADALGKAAEAKRRAEDKARELEISRAVISEVSSQLPSMLEPLLEKVSESARLNTDEVTSAIKGISIEQPLVNVQSPEVNVPEPKVTVNVPEVKVPDIKVPEIKIPEIKVPKITVPKPEVTVNIPEQPPFPTEFSLRGVDKSKPLPVVMMGLDGKPAQFSGGGGFSGKTDFFTIKDIQASSGASLIDNDGFLKVTGAFSVTSSGSSTVSLVNSDGTYYNSDNPLPVTFSAASVQPVSQVSGQTWSVSVNDIFRTTTATNLINSDDRLRVSLETGGSGLTDSELRATSVPVSQVSGAAWSVSVNDIFGSTGTNLVNPDNRLKVELPTGASGLTDTELRASHLDVQQLSGSIDSVYLTGVFGTIGTVTINPDGNPVYGGTSSGGTVQVQDSYGSSITSFGAGDSKGLAVAIVDASGNQITSFGGGTQYSDGATASSPTGTLAMGDTGEESGNIFSLATFSGVASSGTLRVVHAADVGVSVTATQTGTWNIGTVTTVTGITNSVAAAIIDSGGVQYSTSNPVPIGDAGGSLTVDGTVAVSGVTNSVAVVALDRDGNPLTTGPVDNGDAATALRVVVAGNSSSSTDIRTLAGTTIDTNTGASSAGSMRVVLASNSTLSTQTLTDAVATGDTPSFVGFNYGFNGSTWDRIRTGAGNDSGGALRVTHATDATVSTNVVGPVAQGDAASALRVVIAGNSDASVVVSSGTITTVTTITNSVAAAIVDSTGVMYGSANPMHIAVHDSTGSTIASYPSSGDVKGLAVAIIDGSGNQITSFGGGTQYAEGATASTYTGTAMIFAEASTDAAKVVSSVDPLPATLATALSSSIDSVLSRPIKLRGSLATAYATLSTNTETTLISASSATYRDLVWIKFSNTSSGAVTIDLRDVSGGNIVDTYEVPANSSNGISMAVPYPQGNIGNAWTVDYNDADLSNTTVYVSALFSNET